MAAERKVSVEIVVDPTKAEAGAKRAGEAVDRAVGGGRGGNVVSGYQLNKTRDEYRASIASRAAAARAGAGGASGGGTATAGGAMAGQKGAVLVRLIESQFRGIMSLRTAAGAAGAITGGTATDEKVKKETNSEMKDFLGSLRNLRVAFLTAGAAATGFLAAGNPLLFRTFTGSIQLLGARISEMLIPAFLSASGTIQGWANDINNMSAATKGTIGAILKWGGAVVLVTAVASKLYGAFETMGTLLASLYRLGVYVYGSMAGQAAASAAGSAVGGAAGSAAGGAAGGAAAGGAASGLGAFGRLLGRIGVPIALASMAYQGFSALEFNRPAQGAGDLANRGFEAVSAVTPTGATRNAVLGLINLFRPEQGATVRPGTPTGGGPMLSSMVQPAQYAGGEEYYNAVLTQAVAKGQLDQEIMRAIMNNTQRTVELLGQMTGGGQTAVQTAQGLGPATNNGGFLNNLVGMFGT